MKICMVMAGDDEGGLEKHFVELCNELALRQEISVVAIAHDKYRDRFSRGVTFESCDLTRSRRSPFALFALARIVRLHGPDVVHAQANKAAAMVASIRWCIPGVRIATLHNLKKSVGAFDTYPCVIAVSRMAASVLNHDRCKVIYNGLRPSSEYEAIDRGNLAQQFNLDKQKPVFIAVGRMVPAKAFEVLLNAWISVESQLLVVGDGPLLEQLKQQAKDNQLEDRVRFLGHRDDVLSLLASADACVISSRNEGFPYVMVESLFVRNPIISTPVPGCEEVLPQAVQTDYTPQSISKVVNQWSNDIDGLYKLYEDTFTFASEELTVPAMTDHHIETYKSMLNE